jgi:hypothetical protein
MSVALIRRAFVKNVASDQFPTAFRARSMAGVWRFVPQKSRIHGPIPRSWVQVIGVSGDRLSVREEVLRSDGTGLNHAIEASVDGRDFPVTGSPLIDSMAYTRPAPFTLHGKGKKAGVVVLTETVDLKADTLTITYSIRNASGGFVTSVAVFDREVERAG